MRSAVREWLPAEAMAGEAVRSALDAAVRQWSSRFLGRSALGVDMLKPSRRLANERYDGAEWRSLSAYVAVSASSQAVSRLGQLAFGVLSHVTQTEHDRLLSKVFEKKLLLSLAEAIETALGIVGDRPATNAIPADASGGVALISDQSGARVLHLAISSRALIPFCKRSLAPAPRARRPLKDLASALSPTEVVVEASLGRAEVSLDDLRSISPGDVIVLDRALDQPVEIHIKGAGGHVAQARLIEIEGRMALTLLT